MKNRSPDRDPDRPLTHNPFAALRGGEASAVPEQVAEESPTVRDVPAPDAGLVVRREKKGRGGKTVTRVAGLTLAPDDLGELAREMKRALGCGASVDGSEILLQGALTERAASWLRERYGVAVTIGN